jgi:hypothetical protein
LRKEQLALVANQIQRRLPLDRLVAGKCQQKRGSVFLLLGASIGNDLWIDVGEDG